jgi:RecA-family ATPase
LRWHGQENPNINRKWLVKHLLPEIGAGLISGQWGTAKTFVAIDLSISVMTGNPFAARSVKRKGGVLFMAAEGASEIPIRVSGLIETKLPEHKGKLPFAWAESCPMLMVNGAVEQLARIAREAADHMQAAFGMELVLIIIDTMSAAAGFKDENASSEGQFAMNVLNDLSRRTGALVLACDHFGKAIETGTRGTSAKEASADVIVACLGEKTQAGNVTKRWCNWGRDGIQTTNDRYERR